MRRKFAIILKKPLRQDVILKQAKEEDQIIYGARSIQRQLGTVSRATEDYDIFSKNPKQSAAKADKSLDKLYGFDYHYTKPGMHKGTWKVKSKGFDMKKGTADDEGVVDYTKTPKPEPKNIIIGGVRYRVLSEEAKSKKIALMDKEFAFRHDKDRKDLIIIESVTRASNIKRPTIPNFMSKKRQL